METHTDDHIMNKSKKDIPSGIIGLKVLDLTFKEYWALPDSCEDDSGFDKVTYNHYSKLATTQDTYGCGGFMDNYWGPVKDAQQVYNIEALEWPQAWELIGALKGIDKDPKNPVMWKKWQKWERRLGNEKFFDVARAVRWLIGEIENINSIESKILGGKSDPDQEQAGAARLAKLSAKIQTDSLAKAYGVTPSKINKEKYSEMITYLHTHKEVDEYTSNLRDIKLKQMRRNGKA